MKRHASFLGPLALAWIGVIALAAGCPRQDAAPSEPRLAGDNVLLITLDTTRADRIGAYGYDDARTPALDALAARGTLFERAYAQAPITAPSHCSLFTGRYPREHGVRGNGGGVLPETFPTLATLFKEKGYATGAFVAAFVLDDRFGLARGFDVYDDDMGPLTDTQQRLEMQRTGDVVTDRALTWLETVKDSPFFCWVHYFDPHDPYEPPEPYRSDLVNPYDGEIAFMDAQIQRLLDALDAHGLRDSTLILAVGDHGESFGEHGEFGHVMFLYETNLHVPLIVSRPGVVPRGRRISAVVEVADLFPTVAELSGLSLPDRLLTESFAAAFDDGTLTPRAAYAESHHVREVFGWAEQRGLVLARWKYISTAKPELYDLADDPEETQNLIDEHPDVAADMLEMLKQRYTAMTPSKAEPARLDADARRGLAGLGYVAGGNADVPEEFLTPGLADPKDRLDVPRRIREAREHYRAGEFAAALDILDKVVALTPESAIVHHIRGGCLLALGRHEAGRRELERAIELAPDNFISISELGQVLLHLEEYEEAVRRLRAALAINPNDARANAGLAEALDALGYVHEALEHYQRAFAERFPADAGAYEQAARALTDRGLGDDAVALYAQAMERNPRHPKSRFELGMALLRTGKAQQGEEFVLAASRDDPALAQRLFQTGVQRAQQGALTEAKRFFAAARKLTPLEAPASYYLGMIASQEGKTEQAVEYLEAAMRRRPGFDPVVASLSQAYVENGQIADAIRVLERAVEAKPEDVRRLISLAQILATAQDGANRDGARALELTRRALELSKGQNPAVLLVLAGAYAEVGEFDRAIAAAEQLLADPKADEALLQNARTQLAIFRQGKAYRNPHF